VPSERLDEMQEELAPRLAELKYGDPSNDEVRMGPLATAQQLADAREGVAALLKAGVRLVQGSAQDADPIGVPKGRGYFIQPLLLRADAPHEASLVHEHEVFAPCATLMGYRGADDATALVAKGEGTLVSSIYSDDRAALDTLVAGIAPFTGRLLIGSTKVADQAISPGLVLPSCVHGGPGRAGGGEELGGERGLDFYMQRTALQGDRAVLDKVAAGPGEPAAS